MLGFSGIGVIDIAFSTDYANDHTVLLATTDGLYRLVDALQSWVKIDTQTSIATRVTFSPNYQEDHTIFIGTSSGLYYSVNKGEKRGHCLVPTAKACLPSPYRLPMLVTTVYL